MLWQRIKWIWNDIAHSFQIINRIHPTGVSWEAVEFLEEIK